MDPLTISLAAGGGALIPLSGVTLRWRARRRFAQTVRTALPWQAVTPQAWAEQGWLQVETADALPATLSVLRVFYHWAWADHAAPAYWRLREPLRADLPFEAAVRDAWSNLPPEQQAASRAALADAVRTAGEWWGGASSGWNGRPLALLAKDLPRRHRKLPPLPLEPLDDLTAAPLPPPLLAPKMAEEAEGPDLILALAALKEISPRWRHPLAPNANSNASLIAGLGTQVGSDVGARLGAGLGAALGPIGSLVGRHVGAAVGKLGGKALADRALPEEVDAALKSTEKALVRLGRLTREQDLERAIALPEKSILNFGRYGEAARQVRAKRPSEWLMRSQAQALLEETLRMAADDLSVHRQAAVVFVQVARKSPEAVAGGMILQNPWLVLALPDGVTRLNDARRALNDAAMVLRRLG